MFRKLIAVLALCASSFAVTAGHGWKGITLTATPGLPGCVGGSLVCGNLGTSATIQTDIVNDTTIMTNIKPAFQPNVAWAAWDGDQNGNGTCATNHTSACVDWTQVDNMLMQYVSAGVVVNPMMVPTQGIQAAIENYLPTYVTSPTYATTLGALPNTLTCCNNFSASLWTGTSVNTGTNCAGGDANTVCVNVGPNFTTGSSWVGMGVVVGTSVFTIASVTNTTNLELTTSPGNQSAVFFGVGSPFGSGANCGTPPCTYPQCGGTNGCLWTQSQFNGNQGEPVQYEIPFQTAWQVAIGKILRHFSGNTSLCQSDQATGDVTDCTQANQIAAAIGYVRFGFGGNSENFGICFNHWTFNVNSFLGTGFTNAEDEYILHASTNYIQTMFNYTQSLATTYNVPFDLVADTHGWGAGAGDVNAANAEFKYAVAVGWGSGNHGMQKSDLTNFATGVATNANWLGNHLLYAGQTLDYMQLFAADDPSCMLGACASTNPNAVQVGALPPLLVFASEHGIRRIEFTICPVVGLHFTVGNYASLPTNGLASGNNLNCSSGWVSSATFNALGGPTGVYFQAMQNFVNGTPVSASALSGSVAIKGNNAILH